MKATRRQSRHDGGRLRSGGRSWRADRANRQWRKAITAGDGKCRGIHHGKGGESTLNFALAHETVPDQLFDKFPDRAQAAAAITGGADRDTVMKWAHYDADDRGLLEGVGDLLSRDHGCNDDDR